MTVLTDTAAARLANRFARVGTRIEPVADSVRPARSFERSTAPLSIHVQPALAAGDQTYGLTQLVQAAGLPYRMEPCPSPAIYYGMDVVVGMKARVWINAAPRRVRPEPVRIAVMDDLALPMEGEPPERLVVGNRIGFDLGRATAYWLTLENERDETNRDAHGRVPGRCSLINRLGLLARPPVQTYADWLVDVLRRMGACPSVVPRWPNGKRFAVALTHDVDAPERISRGRPLLRRMLLGGSSRREAYWALRSELRSRGVIDACLAAAPRRREWDFDEYGSLEESFGLRSAFYFSVVHRAMGHPCDIDYDAALPRYRRLFRNLRTRGMELGLHTGYLTQQGSPQLEWQAQRLHELTGCSGVGMRHHYLQLNPRHPMRTLQEAACCGLSYDASIGFNDCAGYRAGTALPYFVPRGSSRESGAFVAMPMTIADMHLPRDDAARSIEMVTEHLDSVRHLGGLAVLNWHVGHWHSDPAWRESYKAACRHLAECEDVWVATPAEIATWWLRRAAILGDERHTGSAE